MCSFLSKKRLHSPKLIRLNLIMTHNELPQTLIYCNLNYALHAETSNDHAIKPFNSQKQRRFEQKKKKSKLIFSNIYNVNKQQ